MKFELTSNKLEVNKISKNNFRKIFKKKINLKKCRLNQIFKIPAQTVDIVIDPGNERINNNNPRGHQCPDLSELLNEIGLPEDTVTGNPFLQANKSQEVSFFCCL